MRLGTRQTVHCLLALAASAFLASVSPAQTNSFVSTTDGFWDEARLWSLAAPPSISQSAICITNSADVNVTIDGITVTEFPETMTISNLTITPPQTNTFTVLLEDTGSIALHVLNSFILGNFNKGTGTLISKYSTLLVGGLSGGELEDDGTLIVIGGSLITTNCSLVLGRSQGGMLTITNGGLVEARDVAVGDNFDSTIQISGGTLTVSSSLSLGVGSLGSSSDLGTLIIQDGGLVIITNGTITVGADTDGNLSISNGTLLGSTMNVGSSRQNFGSVSIEDGTVTLGGSLNINDFARGKVELTRGALTVTNDDTLIGGWMSSAQLKVNDGLFLARSIILTTGYPSDGMITINGGITSLSSNLYVGNGGGINAFVFINGGQLLVTNGNVIVGNAYIDPASIEMSGGLLAAHHVVLGDNAFAYESGTLSISGGSLTVSTGIRLGDCQNNDFGYLAVGGGQIIVNNIGDTGFIDLQSGKLTITNGTLQVDNLVMTNSCSQFIHTGGTLIVGKVILDPNAFRIVSVTRQSNDVLVSWLMAPGATNALQAATGNYATNSFSDIFIVTNNTATGVLTNFLDLGAATNKTRFYRARLSL